MGGEVDTSIAPSVPAEPVEQGVSETVQAATDQAENAVAQMDPSSGAGLVTYRELASQATKSFNDAYHSIEQYVRSHVPPDVQLSISEKQEVAKRVLDEKLVQARSLTSQASAKFLEAIQQSEQVLATTRQSLDGTRQAAGTLINERLEQAKDLARQASVVLTDAAQHAEVYIAAAKQSSVVQAAANVTGTVRAGLGAGLGAVAPSLDRAKELARAAAEKAVQAALVVQEFVTKLIERKAADAVTSAAEEVQEASGESSPGGATGGAPVVFPDAGSGIGAS